MKNQEIYNKVNATTAKSAWGKGVKEQALEMIENAEIKLNIENVYKTLLNGAENWEDYSYGGSALIYDGDICERYCSPSVQKSKKFGELDPNATETWLDLQTRALRRACGLIKTNI